MRRVIAVILLALLPPMCGGAGQVFGHPRSIVHAVTASCTAPSSANFSYRWWGDNSANECGSGHTACASGNTSLYQATDGIGTNQFQQGTAADQPTWTASEINGHAAFLFNGSSDTMGSSAGTSWPNTVYATFEVTTAPGSGGFIDVIEVAHGYGQLGSLSVYSSSGVLHAAITDGASNVLLVGTKVLSANTWYTFAATMTPSGAIDLYTCSAGSCTLDNSSTTTDVAGSTTSNMGSQNGNYNFFNGYIAELGISSGTALSQSTLTSTVGAWSKCQYGI